mmetsp:Transcript_6671/g.13883  ORF Transcript_6671/g.13883 Transcript_6671/m.13883 type:complete len:244 (+) Transcript_6671:288-1019(+)
MRLTDEPVYLLDRDGVDFVVEVKTGLVYPVTSHNIHELVNAYVFSYEHVRAHDPVLPQYLRYKLVGLWTQFRKRHGCGHRHPPRKFLPQHHVRWALVEPYSNGLQLHLQYLAVPVKSLFASVQNDQDGVGVSRHRNHLPSPSLSVRRSLDDARKIQNLYLGSLVPHGSWYTREGGELVSRRLAHGLGQLSQKRRFPHRREADECNAGVSKAGHVKTWARLTTSAGAALQKLAAEFGQFRLQRS